MKQGPGENRPTKKKKEYMKYISRTETLKSATKEAEYSYILYRIDWIDTLNQLNLKEPLQKSDATTTLDN